MKSVSRSAVLAAVLAAGIYHAPARGQEAADPKLTALRERCAAGKDKEAPLVRFRPEKYELKKGADGTETVVLKGKYLPAGAVPLAAEKVEFQAAAKVACEAVLNKTELLVDHSAVEFAAPTDLPHVKLQAAANKDGKDTIFLDPTGFDKDGKLALAGRVASDGDKEWLLAAAKKELADAAVGVSGVKVVGWKLDPAALQSKFAAAGGNTARVRFERVRPAWVVKADGTLEQRVVVSGVVLDRPLKETSEAFVAQCKEMWPELLKATPAPGINIENLFDEKRYLPDDELLKRLRAAVAEATSLDGVRIDGPLAFDPQGRLALAGVIPNADAAFAATLAAAVQKFASDAGLVPKKKEESGLTFAAATAGGVSTAKMGYIPLDKLLAEVRSTVADKFDDVLIRRQFFTADGKLTLSGRFPPEASKGEIEKEYRAAAAKYFIDKDPAAQEATINLEPFGAGFTAHLKGVVKGDQKAWYGVLLERGSFTPKGEYVVRGLADRDDQPTALAKLIEAESKNPKWAGYFDTPPAPVALDLMPIAPMLARLKRACPGYVAFNHLELTGVTQDPQDGLVLAADSYAGTQSEAARTAATDLSKQLLACHPDWRRRAKPGVKVNLTPRVETSPESKWLSPNLAAMLLARDQTGEAAAFIASAVRHFPESSSAWYLSALGHALAGDDELAQRDLYRVIWLEGELTPLTAGEAKNHPRTRRYELVEKVGGPRRSWLEQLEPALRREMRDGLMPIQLTPRPLVAPLEGLRSFQLAPNFGASWWSSPCPW